MSLPSPANILVCFAVATEAKPLRPLLANSATPVRICLTGIGPASAEKEIRRQIALSRPDLVISSGFAGALNPKLALGTVIFDVTPDFPLLADLLATGAQPVSFHSTSKVVVTAQVKNMLRHLTGLDAVEMESAAIRAVCSEQKIRSATVRVISDEAGEDLPLDFNELLDPNGRMLHGKLIWSLLCSPAKLWQLWRFHSRLKEAGGNLAGVLARLILGAARRD